MSISQPMFRKNVKFPVARETLPTLSGSVECVSPSLLLRIMLKAVGKRESSAKFDLAKPTPYNAENGQFAPLVKVECRGLEFIGFDPRVSGLQTRAPGLTISGYLEMQGNWISAHALQ